MSSNSKKKELTQEQKMEAEALKRIFEEKKSQLKLNQAEVAEAFGISQGGINHYLNGVNALNAQVATKFAKLLQVSVSAFSSRLALEISDMAKAIDEEEIKLLAENQDDEDDSIIIDVLNVEASAGFGSSSDLVEIVSQLHYAPEQYYEYYRGMNPNNVQVINIKGDSMFPTFSHGDLIFVDTTMTTFDGDGVYVFTYDNYTYIKRLQKAGKELLVISDNDTYKAWTISREELEQLYIHGKVKVHQSQKLNFIG
ncbi:XRE family transcriptional regulator [Muribacter muris]|uniref:XRE family transcriptional regulator n=1 Tax=Muribacter muris TaxID=67855 RepID=A0A4Y9K1M9_9PAST|nr:helix-turn-helix transcriptional regulator [Muribacter muris]MBF0784467.1 helix-turn-helix transcriptional regulator [Muribacter muris]MBF0826237.1 helix-turn-helix transcriptional regulator [Muribacter muris]TFV11981.1 XRE family transcriptional regulator [Muribacter muris]